LPARTKGQKFSNLILKEPNNQRSKFFNCRQVALPDELSYASIDFNKKSILDVLMDAGYLVDQPGFFLWEGVSMYLN
jgi:O-methyltransferase involved in polyketide biosynthesis